MPLLKLKRKRKAPQIEAVEKYIDDLYSDEQSVVAEAQNCLVELGESAAER